MTIIFAASGQVRAQEAITWLGLDISIWVNGVSIIVGAVIAIVVAAIITPRINRNHAQRDQQERILRALIMTRNSPANFDYNAAINLIPIDFKGCTSILRSRKDYISTANKVSDDLSVRQEIYDEQLAMQSALINAIASHLGYDISVDELTADLHYLSNGAVMRENIEIEAHRAWPRIAEALEKQTILSEIAVGLRKLPEESPDQATDPWWKRLLG